MTPALAPTTLRFAHHFWLFAILFASAAVKLAYVFNFTDYAYYLFADTHHFFYRALAFYNGEKPYHVDWDVFPMGYPVLMAGYWKLLSWFGLASHHLQSAMVLNVVNSTAAVALCFHLAWRLWQKPVLALAITACYGFYYPVIFLCAFVLSEHFAQLFFMASLSALVESRRSAKPLFWLVAAGLAWALTCQVRASFGLAAGVALLCLSLQPPEAVSRFKAVFAYAAPAALLFAAAALSLWMASNGASYKPTGNNGGFNFFMVQCHYFGARSIQPDSNWFFYPAIFSRHPELGTFLTKVPFSDQNFYLRESIRCIQELPGSFKRIVALPPTMLYSRFFPSPDSAQGFALISGWFRHINVALLLLSPAGYRALRRTQPQLAPLLAATALILWITFAEFNADHRHLYSLIPVVLVFGLGGVVALGQQTWKQRTRYFGVAALVTATALYLLTGKGYLSIYDYKPVRISAELLRKTVRNGEPWYTLSAFRFWAPVTIDFDRRIHAKQLSLALDSNDVYRLRFIKQGQSLGELELAVNDAQVSGLIHRKVRLPAKISDAGFDQLHLEAISGDDRYSVADLRFSE